MENLITELGKELEQIMADFNQKVKEAGDKAGLKLVTEVKVNIED